MSQNLQFFAKFQKIQLDSLVDFEKCCQTQIYLHNFVLIQPKTSEILPKICQKQTTTLRIQYAASCETGTRGTNPAGIKDYFDHFLSNDVVKPVTSNFCAAGFSGMRAERLYLRADCEEEHLNDLFSNIFFQYILGNFCGIS